MDAVDGRYSWTLFMDAIDGRYSWTLKYPKGAFEISDRPGGSIYLLVLIG
jgi:hypothetical protein